VRIGIIAPPWLAVPPATYGGTEGVVDNLARGLLELGNDVRLFTVGTSACPVQRSWEFDAPAEEMGSSVAEAAHVLAAYDEFCDSCHLDVVHDHTVLGPLLGALAHPRRPPTVVTHHGVFDSANRRIFEQAARVASVVAISSSQAIDAGAVPIAAVIHHGIDLELFRPGGPDALDAGYLFFIGRMSADKGVHRAIRVARRCRRPLVVVAKMRAAEERAYFAERVEPSLETRLDLQRGASALINPISWPEPFGLVMVEALATGTPVIAFAHGAAPEIVDDGRTGFLCADETEMVAAVDRLPDIDRTACRAAAEARFSRRRMARDYLALYRRVIAAPVRGMAQPAARGTARPAVRRAG
jgi:glycosyltransferase involved in cell wall biosynthesis